MAQIKDEKHYQALLKRIEEIFFQTDGDTPQDDPRLLELDLLSAMVEEYEKERFPIEVPTLSASLQAWMKESRCSQKDLAALLGITAPRLCDILSRKKTPTYRQAQTIVQKLGIAPAIVLTF